MLRESRLREISFRLVPGSVSYFLLVSFLVPCPYLKRGRKCAGSAEMQGFRIGEQSGERTMRVERRTIRPRCTKCRTRIRITQTAWEQLLSEARKFLNPKLRRREGIASQA